MYKLLHYSCYCYLLICSFYSLANELTQEQLNLALTLEKKIYCPVCSGQTVSESDAPASLAIKATIKTMVAEGKTESEIIDYFKQTYGDYIIAKPPFNRRTLLLWLSPWLVLGIFSYAVYKKLF